MPPDNGVTVLIPVKWTGRGKSRIDVPAARRQLLALAMAQDTVAAVASTEQVRSVVVITEDPSDAAALRVHPKVVTVHTTVAGLNESLAQAIAALPADLGPVAVLPGDLPDLRPTDLSAALLAAAGTDRAVVADRDDLGSTLLYASSPAHLQPAYGGASYQRHRAAGAVGLELPPTSTLRHDVDLADHLVAVRGPRTAAVLAG